LICEKEQTARAETNKLSTGRNPQLVATQIGENAWENCSGECLGRSVLENVQGGSDIRIRSLYV